MDQMRAVLPVRQDDDGQQWVGARALHTYLGVGTKITEWFQDRCRNYGFIEGEDFFRLFGKSTGGRPAMDWDLTLDMAKELSMVEHNERGRKARRYFIRMEKEAHRLAREFRPAVIQANSLQDRAAAGMILIRGFAEMKARAPTAATAALYAASEDLVRRQSQALLGGSERPLLKAPVKLRHMTVANYVHCVLGVDPVEVMKHSSRLGLRVSNAYLQKYGVRPEKNDQWVKTATGKEVPGVCEYAPEDFPLIENAAVAIWGEAVLENKKPVEDVCGV